MEHPRFGRHVQQSGCPELFQGIEDIYRSQVEPTKTVHDSTHCSLLVARLALQQTSCWAKPPESYRVLDAKSARAIRIDLSPGPSTLEFLVSRKGIESIDYDSNRFQSFSCETCCKNMRLADSSLIRAVPTAGWPHIPEQQMSRSYISHEYVLARSSFFLRERGDLNKIIPFVDLLWSRG
jgi:hypothetical protein